MTKLQNLLKGLIKENPVLVLVLGTCPTLPSLRPLRRRSAWALRRPWF